MSGENDEVWISKTFCENIIERLESCGFKNNKEHYCYKNSVSSLNKIIASLDKYAGK